MKSEIARFAAENIKITPGGIWEYDDELARKMPIEPNRQNHAEWSSYPKDNMGKHFITKEQNLLIVDIDGEVVERDSRGIYIPLLDLFLPNTFMTTTSRSDKFHLYYRTDTSLMPNRVVAPKGKVDFFTYGNIFDMHFYSEHSTLSEHSMIEAPASLLKVIEAVTPKGAAVGATQLLPVSNVARYNLTVAYLADEFTTNKSWNAFFRSVFPSEYIEDGKKKIDFSDFELSYDLINKVAVKLSTTKELGTAEHIIPALRQIVGDLGGDPEGLQTTNTLMKQIIPTLPNHLPEKPYNLMDDALTIIEHVAQQPVPTPLFRVLVGGKVRFMELDRFSLEPVKHNNEYFLEQKAAQTLHPERNIVSEAGKVVGWDDQVPVIYITDSPYDPPLFVDAETNRNVVNLYERTQYIKQAVPNKFLATSNIFSKLLSSSVHPDYKELIIRYYAEVIFGKRAPTMVLWFASLKSDKGGTGKSIITIDIFSRLLGTAGAVVSEEDMAGNWGDTLIGARTISLEDLPNLGSRQFDKLYSAIKQSTSSSKKRLNMKFGSFRTERLNVCITGSSNERLSLHPSDRRFLCIEPAHLRGHTEPLNNDDSIELEMFRNSDEYSQELQDFTDYLLYIHEQPLSKEHYRELFIEAPETPYRTKWITSGQSNTQNIIVLLKTPRALHDTVRIDELNCEDILSLYELITLTFNPKSEKVALPWNWFQEILPYIQADHGDGVVARSKAQLSKALSVDFTTNVGTIYTDKWSRKWKQAGYIYQSSKDQMNDWNEVIEEVKHEFKIK